jgi:hypothetical protein
MKDCSFTVDRGADQSILFNIFTTETGTTRKNLTGCTVTAFIGAGTATITKVLRIVDAPQGVAALDLTPAESRLILSGQRMDAEIELREGSLQIIVGRGRVTGLGGINLDT